MAAARRLAFARPSRATSATSRTGPAITHGSAALVVAIALFAAFTRPAAAAPVFRGGSSASVSVPGEALSLPTPEGVQEGDVLVAALAVRVPGFVPLVAPPGWKLVRSDSNDPLGASLTHALYIRVATGSEPATHTWSWTFSTLVGAAGGIVAYGGVDRANPVDTHSGRYSNAVASFAAPSVTTSASVELLLGFFASNGAGGLTTDMTTRLQPIAALAGSDVELAAAELAQPQPGPSGDQTAADAHGNTNSSNIGQLLALRGAIPPANVVAPHVDGVAREGELLIASPGEWTGTEPIRYAYQWRRCDASGQTCTNVAGATENTYVPTSDDAGSTLRVVVVASNDAGETSATSEPTAAVAPLHVAAPVFRGGSSASVSVPGEALSLPTPEGVQEGDVLVAALAVRVPGFVPLVAPPGWKLVRSDSNDPLGASLTQALYIRVATGSEPATHTWSWTFCTLVGAAGGIVAYGGVDRANPVDTHSGRYSNAVASFAAPSVTTSAPAELLLGFFASNGAGGLTTDMTTRLQPIAALAGSDVELAAAELAQRDPGPSGDQTAADAHGNTNSSNIGQLLALRAAGATAPADQLGSALPPRLRESTGPTYYVSPEGSDANPGTLAQPWATIQKALDSLMPGEIALVRAGTYSQNLLMSRSGTAIAPITVRNYPGERPVLRPGTGATDNMPLQLGNGAAYVRFQGLTIEGATGPSTTNVYAWGNAHNIELSQCELRNSQRQGFFSEATTSSIQLLGCYIHDNGGSGPIQLDHNVYMEGQFHLIADCLIKNAPNGFGVQIYPSSDHVIVTENTIVGALRDGIIVGSDGATTTSNLTLTNNVVAFNGRYGISTYWAGAVGTGILAANNLVWGNGADQLSGSGISYSGSVLADPLFVDRTGGNLHLQATSPGRDRGLAPYARPTDLDGVQRPQGPAPDLGAYEY